MSNLDDSPPEDVDKEASPGLFGRSISEVPCLRNSLLSGIGGGLGVGFATFLFTSNVRKSTNFGFGSYMLVTMGMWFYCRYRWSEDRVTQRQLRYALQKRVLIEGTEKDTGYSKLEDV